MSAAAPTTRDPSSRRDGPGSIAGRSPRQLIWARFREDLAALIGFAVLVLLTLIAIFAGVISKYVAGHAPDELFQQTMTDEFGVPLGSNWEFYFDGDSVGRDLVPWAYRRARGRGCSLRRSATSVQGGVAVCRARASPST